MRSEGRTGTICRGFFPDASIPSIMGRALRHWSTKEINIRNRFRAVAAMVQERKEDLMKVTQDQAAFLAQKDTAGGKKTMKAYLWMVCGAEYDAQNS